MGLFSPTINYQIKELGSVELQGDDAVIIDGDCDSSKECRKLVKYIFENYKCKSCGSDKLEGKGVIVEIRKMKLFETVKKNKLFDGYKY